MATLRGVTGISYGGFMSAWLVTQDQRFAAAVPISAVSDWFSQHRTSQIPLLRYIVHGRCLRRGDIGESVESFPIQRPGLLQVRNIAPGLAASIMNTAHRCAAANKKRLPRHE